MTLTSGHSPVIESTRRWVQEFVVGLQLCPFASRALDAGRVRFVVTQAATTQELLVALHDELLRLQQEPAIETTVLVHPDVLREFDAYNQFLNQAEELLVARQLEGVFQLASFHPAYQFAGTRPDAAENFSNRSPYPMLHLLRESSVEAAIASHPDVDAIPERNIARLQALGADHLRARLKAC